MVLISQDNKDPVEKLIQLEPNHWRKFQEYFNKEHSAEFQQVQIQQKEDTNKEKSNDLVQGKNIEFTTESRILLKIENLPLQSNTYIGVESIHQKPSKTD